MNEFLQLKQRILKFAAYGRLYQLSSGNWTITVRYQDGELVRQVPIAPPNVLPLIQELIRNGWLVDQEACIVRFSRERYRPATREVVSPIHSRREPGEYFRGPGGYRRPSA